MSTEFKNFLAPYEKSVQRIAIRARALIFDVIPGVSEHVYPAMKVVRYGLEGNKMAGIVCYLTPLKAGVNLGFHHGTSLQDPEGLLEGTGKNLRHVKLKSAEDVDHPALRALLEDELAVSKRALASRSL